MIEDFDGVTFADPLETECVVCSADSPSPWCQECTEHYDAMHRCDCCKLTIAAAAIRVGQMVYALPSPARHHTVMWWLAGLGPDTKPHGGPVIYAGHIPEHEQGFITSRGLFVGREAARSIAENAKQLLPRASALPELYSEDVW